MISSFAGEYQAAHYNPSASAFAASFLSGESDDNTIMMSTSYVDSGVVKPLYNPTASAIESAHAFMDSYLAAYGPDSFQSVISDSSALTSLLSKPRR